MQVLKKSKVLFVDVDRTLIVWEEGCIWHPHKEHLALIEQFWYQNHGIVVWSAGGVEWAEKAVRLLGIEDKVDLIISKPDWYVDDLPAQTFMPEANRIFLPEEKKTDKV